MALCVPGRGLLPRLRWPPPQGLSPVPSCRLRPPSLPVRLGANMPRSYAPSEGILRPWLPPTGPAAYADPRNQAPLEQGPAGARRCRRENRTSPSASAIPVRDSRFFFEKRSQSHLGIARCDGPTCLGRLPGSWFRRPPPRTVWMSCHSSRSGLDII